MARITRQPALVPASRRKFSGKTFKRHGSYEDKHSATVVAGILKRQGWRTRIVPHEWTKRRTWVMVRGDMKRHYLRKMGYVIYKRRP